MDPWYVPTTEERRPKKNRDIDPVRPQCSIWDGVPGSWIHTIIQCKPNLNSSIQDNFTATNTRRNLLAWLVQQTEGLGDRDARMNQRTKETGMRG